jgi:hypothetical protein
MTRAVRSQEEIMVSSKVLPKLSALAASVLLYGVSFTHPANAQATPPAPTTRPAEVVPEKGLKTRMFSVAHRDAVSLVPVLRPLGSGAPGAVLSADSGFGTISARDFPENLATIEDALKRLDVAEPARGDVELKVHVLLASSRPDAAAALPEDLKEVVAALRGTLLYKSYTLVTTFDERVRDRARVVKASGVAALPAPEGKEQPTLQLDCEMGRVTVDSGTGLVTIEDFSLSAGGIRGFTGRAAVRTDLTLRSGEKVVVGTSSLGDRGLVVVVSATAVK